MPRRIYMETEAASYTDNCHPKKGPKCSSKSIRWPAYPEHLIQELGVVRLAILREVDAVISLVMYFFFLCVDLGVHCLGLARRGNLQPNCWIAEGQGDPEGSYMCAILG